MDDDQYSDRYTADEPDEGFNNKIRLVIFLIFAECSGWAALVCALVFLHRHRKNKGRIPALVTIVLLNNVLELLLNPYIIAKLIQNDFPCDITTPCRRQYSLWGSSVISGVHLQQMMVLESVLVLRYPSCSAKVFFTSCFIILYIITFISFFLCMFFHLFLYLYLTVIPLVSMNVISWIVVCRKPPKEHSSNRTKKPDLTLLAFTTNTLILYFLSTFTAFIFWEYKLLPLWMMSLCLLSLRVMVDPLLCVFVYKLKNTELPEQTAVEAEQSVET